MNRHTPPTGHPYTWSPPQQLVAALSAWLLDGPHPAGGWPHAVVAHASARGAVVRTGTQNAVPVYNLTDGALGWFDQHKVYAAFLRNYARALLQRLRCGDVEVRGAGEGLVVVHRWATLDASAVKDGADDVAVMTQRQIVHRAADVRAGSTPGNTSPRGYTAAWAALADVARMV